MSVPRRLVPVLLLLVLVASGCAQVAPTSPPAPQSAPAVAAADRWTVADLPLDRDVLDAPTLEPGYQCHPCHYLAENQLLGVASTPRGVIAVGVQQPPAHGIAFVSTDARTWSPLAGFEPAEGTAAVAVTADEPRVVIVGHDGDGPTSWSSEDGRTWAVAPDQESLAVPAHAGDMLAVVAFDGGFVAAGFRDDPLHAAASGAVWRSRDGLTWQPDDRAPFAGGRIRGLAALGSTLVAVGTAGDPNYGPAAAWRWTAGGGWQRARIDPDAGGAMRAVVAFRDGFVAVGQNADDDGARVWTSPDGLTWTALPDAPAFHSFDQPVRMQAITVGPDGLVVGGWRSDPGKGSGVTWTSPDGRAWQGPTWETSFAGGQVTGVAATGGTLVAVGRTGYPDWNRATIWTAPAP